MKRLRNIGITLLAVMLTYAIQAQDNPAKIISISVDSSNYPTIQGRVNITYEPTSLAEIDYFNLYLIRNGDNQKVHELSKSQSSYLYTESKAHKQSEGFRLSAEPNLSWPITDPHYTVYLQAEKFDSCSQTIPLKWNNYIGWTDGIKEYEVFVKIENTGFEQIATTSDTIYNFTPAEFETKYIFLVKAVSNSAINSLSNIIEFTTGSWTNLDSSEAFIDTVLNNDSQIQLQIQTDTPSLITGILLYSKNTENDTFTLTDTISTTNKNRYWVNINNADDKSFFYKAAILNLCQQAEIETNTIRTLTINGSNKNNTVALNWDKSFIGLDETFEIQVDIDNTGFNTIDNQLVNTQKTYNLLDLGTELSENFCFRCLSYANSSYYSQSNTLCFVLQPTVQIPNAFTPNNDGLNDTFGPIIKNAQMANYIFIIYDRYGGKVFETNSETDRWDGKYNSQSTTEGLYLYYIKFTTQTGSQYEKSGTVNIIFP